MYYLNEKGKELENLIERITMFKKDCLHYIININDIDKIINTIEELQSNCFYYMKSNNDLVRCFNEIVKELKINSFSINENIILNHINNNYIHKDKIRKIVDERNKCFGYNSLDAMDDIEKLLIEVEE